VSWIVPLERCLRHGALLVVLGGFALAAPAVWASYEAWLHVDGSTRIVRSYRSDAGSLLREAGVVLSSEDLVQPMPSGPVGEGDRIVVARAVPVAVAVDGDEVRQRTHLRSVGAVLEAMDLPVLRGDAVLRHGVAVGFDDPVELQPALEVASLVAYAGGLPEGATPRWGASVRQVRLAVDRAMRLEVSIDGVPAQTGTRAATVGEALREMGLNIRRQDLVLPPIETSLNDGLRVQVQRAKDTSIEVDGRRITWPTRSRTVGDLIQEARIVLAPLDRVSPAFGAAVTRGLVVRVTRVNEQIIVETEPVPFATEVRADPDLEIDQSRLAHPGRAGVLEREVRLRYENGQLSTRQVLRQEQARPPEPRVWTYGTKIVVRQLETPQGPVGYWRQLRVWATSYTPADGAWPAGHPSYGRTRIGLQAGRGVVAVDPSLIPFYTRLYVPGYGEGLAGDTGGGVIGSHIDLGFNDGDTGLWSSRWVEAYWLTPVPDPGQIRWMLPGTQPPP